MTNLIQKMLAGGILALGVLLANKALAENPVMALTLFNDATKDVFTSHSGQSDAGEQILWHSELQTRAGDRVGISSGVCQKLNTDGHFYCTLVLDVNGKGIISAMGVQQPEPEPSTFVVTGGTGKYQGITGSLDVVPVENRSRFRFDLSFQLPSA